jgi:hypothetical protein
VREVQYLPSHLGVETLRLEAFEEMYSDRRILSPGRLQMSGHSSLAILACIIQHTQITYIGKCVVMASGSKMMLLAVIEREQPHHKTSLLVREQ